MKIIQLLAFIILIFVPITGTGQLIDQNVDDLQKIGVDEHLGEQIPLDLQFIDSNGDTILLSKYFGQGKPVMLVLHYTDCPMLCSLVLDGAREAVNELAWTPGVEFQILSVSVDPRDTPERSWQFQNRYHKGLKANTPEDAWVFLSGEGDQSRALADALGFKYFWVEESKEIAHPAVLFILTEDGTISRYLYGIQFREFDLRMGLLEASEGKIGTTVDQLILYCFHYDPDSKGYAIFAQNVMKLGGVVSLFLLGGLIGMLVIREKRKQ